MATEAAEEAGANPPVVSQYRQEEKKLDQAEEIYEEEERKMEVQDYIPEVPESEGEANLPAQ